MLKAVDVAAVLGCSTAHAYRLLQKKQIPSVRLNGAVRVPRAALEIWLEQQSQAALQRWKEGNEGAA